MLFEIKVNLDKFTDADDIFHYLLFHMFLLVK
jgi:hypothetical protein